MKKLLSSLLALVLLIGSTAALAANCQVGVLYPLSGNVATIGQLDVLAIELTAEIINNEHPELDLPFAAEAGIPGLEGGKLVLNVSDTQGNAEIGQSEAERLIDEVGVDVIIGAYNSAVTKTASTVAERSEIPFINAGSTPVDLTERGYEWFFRTTPHDGTFIEDSFKFLASLRDDKGLDIQTLALFHEDTEYGAKLRAQIEEQAPAYDGLQVLFDVSFQVARGQIVGFVGSNGAGKTTTLRAVTGLTRVTGGKVIYEGKDVTNQKPNLMPAMGMVMVPEGRHLFPKMSVRDNLMMGAFLCRDKKRIAESLDRIYSIFPRVKERSKQLAGTLSGGEQQMVAIARGLMTGPKLLILDEPSLGLMPKLVEEVFDFVREINRMGITVIIVEQNVTETLQMCDYAYVINNGATVIDGTGAGMLDCEEIRSAYLGL